MVARRRGTGTMPLKLSQPNSLLGCDAASRPVLGHDGAMEASFFVNEDALKRIEPSMEPDESRFPKAFDSHRDVIYTAATRAYWRGRKGLCELAPADF